MPSGNEPHLIKQGPIHGSSHQIISLTITLFLLRGNRSLPGALELPYLMPNGIELRIALLLGFVVLGELLESVVEERR